MPKAKTHRGAAKRFSKTGGGLIKRGCAYRRHILTKKSRARKRALRAGGYVDAANLSIVNGLLPN